MLIPKFDLYKTEWLDLVFSDRNKNYGAYELRSHYSQTMLRAIAITVSGVVATVLTIAVVTKRPQLPVEPIENTITVDLAKVMQPPPQTKPIKPVSHQPATPSVIKTVVIPTHVTSDPVKDINPPTIKDLQISAVGSETHKGDAAVINPPVTSTITTGTGSGTATGVDDSNIIHTYADVSPEPNGGMAGWSKFLQSHIRYPDTDVQGRVLLSFVVERDGSLSDIKVIRSVDSQLDAEAIRVLKIAPKWKPGMQSGNAVRVQYTIPINFQQNN